MLSEIPRHAGWLGPRFTLYASFMTQITIEACQPDNWLDVLSKDEYPLSDYFLVDHDLFHALTECTEEPIFPALECLTVAWNPDVDNRNTALAFINPRLEELRVFVEFRRSETPLDVDMLLEFLENAQQRASGIRIVNVVGFIEEDDKPADAIPCVPGLSGWTNLTEFELPFAISDAVWNILTTLTSLRTLWVEAVELRPSPRSYMFPSLEVICLASIPLSTALVVLGSLQAPNLKEINMTGDGQGSINTYSHLFSLLAQHCKLEVLSLDFGEGQPADDGSSETNHMDISVIAPILESCSLKSFSADLQLHEPEDHNSIIIACQTAWHQLHSLEFSYNGVSAVQ